MTKAVLQVINKNKKAIVPYHIHLQHKLPLLSGSLSAVQAFTAALALSEKKLDHPLQYSVRCQNASFSFIQIDVFK